MVLISLVQWVFLNYKVLYILFVTYELVITPTAFLRSIEYVK